MLKKRICAALVIKNDIVVQSIGFKKYLPVGKPAIAVEFLNNWGIDEILLIDISANRSGKLIDPKMLSEVSKKCFVPLTACGGIKKIEDVDQLIRSGADKVCINNHLLQDPHFITTVSSKYGSQCIIAAVDILKNASGNYTVYDHLTGKSIAADPLEMIRSYEAAGAGEILLNCVDRDGQYNGFDIELSKLVSENIKIPVIVMGGAGNPEHFKELFEKTTVPAAAAANFFHFKEHCVNLTKSFLVKKKGNVRLETKANYLENEVDANYRLKKKSDKTLEDLLFIKIEKEVI